MKETLHYGTYLEIKAYMNYKILCKDPYADKNVPFSWSNLLLMSDFFLGKLNSRKYPT